MSFNISNSKSSAYFGAGISFRAVMNGLAETAGSLSRKLRSKNVSTTEVYDISIKLLNGDIAVYFPKKEIFVLDLIVDRWNNQKNVHFKRDPQIWRLFNLMWESVQMEDLRKKTFKSLKYVPHLIQTLELPDLEHNAEVACVLQKNFELLNSSLSVEMNTDQALLIIAGVLKVILDCPDIRSVEREKLIEETMRLTNMHTHMQAGGSNKLSSIFCQHPLSSILQYNAEYHNSESNVLSMLVSVYLFGPDINSMKQLTTFVDTFGRDLSNKCLTVLFKECIHEFSKSSMSQLEEVFSLLTKARPGLAIVLLEELCSLKQTLSQQFLESLFDEFFQKLSKTSQEDDWKMINRIITLDLEVGIINTRRIMDKVATEETTNLSAETWENLIECYVNARELPKLLTEWKEYSISESGSTCFVDVPEMANKITKNISALSVLQMHTFFKELFNDLRERHEIGDIILKALGITILGLRSLPYNHLPDLEPVLSQIFDLHIVKKTSAYWSYAFHFLDLYDDIFSEDSLSQIHSSVTDSLKRRDESSDLFFTAFKLRELRDYDLESTIEKFMAFFLSAPKSERQNLTSRLFSRWSTIVNMLFSQDQISILVEGLLDKECRNFLTMVTSSDDFYEEDRVVYSLIAQMVDNVNDQSVVEQFSIIPIKCISKAVRIRTIDTLCEKSILTARDVVLVTHLLSNPTFKSSVEVDVNVLDKILSQDSLSHLTDPILDKIISNHISQRHDKVSELFITKLVDHVVLNLRKGLSIPATKIAVHLLSKLNFDDSLVKGLQDIVLETLFAFSTQECNVKDRKATVIWSLRVLYELHQGTMSILSKDKIDVLIKGLMGSYHTGKLDLELTGAIFPLYCCAFRDQPKILSAHYIVLRQSIPKELLYDAIDKLVTEIADDFTNFNDLLDSVVASFHEQNQEYVVSLLELLEILLPNLQKENVEGRKLFAQAISEFSTHLERIVCQEKQTTIGLMEKLKDLLVWKPWLFGQYTIEILFPCCLRANISLMKEDDEDNDTIFICTSQLLSHVILYHRFKLTNRHHLVISYLCASLELFTANSNLRLTQRSGEAYSRLISVFCEPSNDTKNNKQRSSLQSQVGQIKKSLRRHAPILLLKYINLAINSAFTNDIKESINGGVFSIFDVLSSTELAVVNASLDNPGRVYFKTMYADYKRDGKWRED
ncbi:LADA_0H18272g1_1 [Lachancea dasiensis]|uniref:LADA_0H18272g1_1 n=1 Tax=Lachancea dasiensis TaxID=1072105 RepID=A0A1G4K5Z0_9SACH|nr:LADA_0H18272g1_1 [Lachancea dasiensis]